MALIDSLISYWKLDESSGNALDAHGSNTGTDSNTVGAAAGKIGGARDFELSNSGYFDCGDPANLRLSTFSVSAWINGESWSGTGTRTVVAKTNVTGGGNLRNYHLDVTTGGKVRFGFTSSAGVFQGFTESTATLSTGTWYHIVGTWDGTTVNLYINGSLDNSTDPAGTPTPNTTTGNLCIGRLGPNNAAYFDGLIDEVGIWGRALTADEVAQLNNGGAGIVYPFGITPNKLAGKLARKSLVA